MLAHKADLLDRWLGSFNTPKTAQLNQLYEDLLGLKHFAESWSWQGMSALSAQKKLDGFISLRGDIAHRLKPVDAIHKGKGSNYLGHVTSIVDCCERAVYDHLHTQTNKVPW